LDRENGTIFSDHVGFITGMPDLVCPLDIVPDMLIV
jgi:hypothetical protein